MKPFRWNISKVEQLGGLLTAQANSSYPGYTQQLSDCAAKVLARSQGRRLVFVGRSPENLFDYLSGIFASTEYADNLDILNISNRFYQINEIVQEFPQAHQALKAHFRALNLSPKQIIATPNGVCFCDLVSLGGTFENIFNFIKQWTLDEKGDLPALERKLTFIGITNQSKNSPNTWRWQQHADWVKQHNKITVKNVSIEWSLWNYLGNDQTKVTRGNPPKRWGNDDILLPPRQERHIKALKQAYDIYCLAAKQKQTFSEKLAACPEIKEAWLRQLLHTLRS